MKDEQQWLGYHHVTNPPPASLLVFTRFSHSDKETELELVLLPAQLQTCVWGWSASRLCHDCLQIIKDWSFSVYVHECSFYICVCTSVCARVWVNKMMRILKVMRLFPWILSVQIYVCQMLHLEFKYCSHSIVHLLSNNERIMPQGKNGFAALYHFATQQNKATRGFVQQKHSCCVQLNPLGKGALAMSEIKTDAANIVFLKNIPAIIFVCFVIVDVFLKILFMLWDRNFKRLFFLLFFNTFVYIFAFQPNM